MTLSPWIHNIRLLHNFTGGLGWQSADNLGHLGGGIVAILSDEVEGGYKMQMAKNLTFPLRVWINKKNISKNLNMKVKLIIINAKCPGN